MAVKAGQKGLSRECIKYMAMVTMFLNHFAQVCLTPSTALWELFINIGYFTAPVMCYFLVEGFGYTHSRKKYALRLFVFALISQVPYTFALNVYMLNMLFSLLICLCIVAVMECTWMGAWKAVPIFLLIWVSIFTDWALFAPLFTILFVLCKSDKRKYGAVFGALAILFFISYYPLYMNMYGKETAWLHGAYASTGIVVAGIVILCLYNGKQARVGKKFSKWFFYIFYPAHLALLGLAARLIRG